MSTNPKNPAPDVPIYDVGNPHHYSLEILAEMSGVSSKAILYYQEQGLISQDAYDDDSLHTLRRIEHVRGTCEANVTGLKLILHLMDEVERLQTVLRRQH